MMRLRDVLSASIGLLLFWPLFIVIALAIRIDSPGPVFFRQTRVGRDGRHFQIHKFRTMQISASGPAVSPTGDPRVTRVGRLLRRSKLDELPQFLDVIRGDMGLVGPRPEVPQYVNLWPQELRSVILSVRPGITDPITVRLRSEAEILAQAADPERVYIEELLPLKVKEYANYVATRSSMGDLRIIVNTLVAVVFPRGLSETAEFGTTLNGRDDSE